MTLPETSGSLKGKTVRRSPRQERYAEMKASPYFESMNADRRACAAFLRSDLYRLDDTALWREGEAERPEFADSMTLWRYVNPPRTLFVTLNYGERTLLGHVERADGTLVSATTHATTDWLDEVLP